MNQPLNADWQGECLKLGLDPQEVKKVSSRYDMYRDYTVKETGDCLPLKRWYKWYRVEKLSEGHATRTPPPGGCSVELGTDSEVDQAVVSETDFLYLLKLFRGS